VQAWKIDQHGGLDQLVRRQVADPVPGPLEALVRVEAVGLNHLDLWVRKGVPGHQFPLPLTPGCDIAGVIADFGPGAQKALATADIRGDALTTGSAVIINPGLSCGRCEACLSGQDPLCRHYGILGETCDGGCSDLITVPIANLIARPPGLSAEAAAALPIPYLTAWTMLFEKAGIRPGDACLVHAGGSGVSVAAIQMAKMIGAHVITTVGSQEKAAKARALGADATILYKDKPFRQELKPWLAALGKKGCDIVVDHVGQDTFAESLRALTWGGKLVCCGATSGADVSLDLKTVFFKNISVLGSTMGSKADLLRVVDLVAQGKLKAVVDSVFEMNDLPRAHERLESRQAFGKVVVVN
jgi:NADPH:quinone reductase-like Zn-dependent oxidoreductase